MDVATLPLTALPNEENAARAFLQAVVGSAFEIRDRLGRGGYADVFLAFDPQLKRTVAIKVLRRDLQPTEELVRRFRREAESIAALRHPNLLPVHTIGEGAGTVFIVFEHIRGETLDQYLKREGPAPIDEAIRILSEVSAALGTAHDAGILHRDLKPSNIMLEGPERRALLMDFGLAAAVEDTSTKLTGAGMLLGTPHYMSPEQAAGDAADHRSDIYSLGVVAYEIVTGAPPFTGQTISQILAQHLTAQPARVSTLRTDCPPNIAETIERALSKSPADRWSSARELSAMLRKTEEPTNIGAAGPAAEEPRPAGKHFLRSLVLAVPILVLLSAADWLRDHALSWSLLLVAAVVILFTMRYATLWRAGHTWRSLMTDQIAKPADLEQEEFGRHSALIKTARMDRTLIVRALSGLARVEQQQLQRCMPAADALLGRCLQLARRLRSLDQQIAAERAKQPDSRSDSRPRKLLDEQVAARGRAAEQLSETATMLGDLRAIVEHPASQTADITADLARLLSVGDRLIAPEI